MSDHACCILFTSAIGMGLIQDLVRTEDPVKCSFRKWLLV